MKKFCVIIDAYPQSEEDQKILLDNLLIFQKHNIDVLLTSHHPCTPEIIENTTYFLFEKKNNYHFLDSDVLNYNLEGVENPIYLSYLQIGNEMFRDYVVITGWSVAIMSQFFNSVKFVYSKGYEFCFYFVGDFRCPVNILEKLNVVFKDIGANRNFFIRNSPNFNSWFSGFFFGFKVDKILIDRIPNLDFSENSVYQKYFPNCSGEDVILRIFGQDENLIWDHQELNNFFGIGNWNLKRSVIQPGPSSLHSQTISSLFWKEDLSDCYLLFNVQQECPFDNVRFIVDIINQSSKTIFSRDIILVRGGWHKEKLNNLFSDGESVIFNKKIQDIEETCSFSDSIEIRKDLLPHYALLKNYYKIE